MVPKVPKTPTLPPPPGQVEATGIEGVDPGDIGRFTVDVNTGQTFNIGGGGRLTPGAFVSSEQLAKVRERAGLGPKQEFKFPEISLPEPPQIPQLRQDIGQRESRIAEAESAREQRLAEETARRRRRGRVGTILSTLTPATGPGRVLRKTLLGE